MKYIILFFLVILTSCIVPQSKSQNSILNNKRICGISLIFNQEFLKCSWEYSKEDNLEDLLFYQKENTIIHRIQNSDSLQKFLGILSCSQFICKDSNHFDSDVWVIVEYSDLSCDTLGISLSNDAQYSKGDTMFSNLDLVQYIVDVLPTHDKIWKEFKAQHYWNGKFKYNGAPQYDITLDPDFVPNYGIFHKTPAEHLAKYMASEMFDSILSVIKVNPELMYSRDVNGCYSLIQNAIMFQQDSIVHLFLKNGFDPNRQTEFPGAGNSFVGPYEAFESPLMTCCHNSCFNRCAKLLIQYGANVNDNYAYLGLYPNPLWIAIASKNYEMIQYLIEYGANIEDLGLSTNIYGEKVNFSIGCRKSALDIALSSRPSYKIIENLLLRGAKYETPFINQKGGFCAILNNQSDDSISPVDKRIKQNIINCYLKGEH